MSARVDEMVTFGKGKRVDDGWGRTMATITTIQANAYNKSNQILLFRYTVWSRVDQVNRPESAARGKRGSRDFLKWRPSFVWH